MKKTYKLYCGSLEDHVINIKRVNYKEVGSSNIVSAINTDEIAHTDIMRKEVKNLLNSGELAFVKLFSKKEDDFSNKTIIAGGPNVFALFDRELLQKLECLPSIYEVYKITKDYNRKVKVHEDINNLAYAFANCIPFPYDKTDDKIIKVKDLADTTNEYKELLLILREIILGKRTINKSNWEDYIEIGNYLFEGLVRKEGKFQLTDDDEQKTFRLLYKYGQN